MQFIFEIKTPKVKEGPINKSELLGKQRYIVTLEEVKIL